MLPIVVQLNFILALGTIALQVGTIVFFGILVQLWHSKCTDSFTALVSRFAVPLVLLLAFGASVMTLVYSEIFGFIPCGLCWLERIALYPQVVISAVALFMRDRVAAPAYLVALSVCGAIVSLYHHYLQMGGSELVACPVTTVSCAQRILFEFNYITYPLLAFSLFVFIIALFLLKMTHDRIAASSRT